MRKLGKTIATLIVGGILGTFGWQVAVAAPPTNDTLVVCQKPGNDLRSPATNGTCPSGYTLVEITETPPAPPVPPAGLNLAHKQAKAKFGAAVTGDVISMDLPAGDYAITASGKLSGADSATCSLVGDAETLDAVVMTTGPGHATDNRAMTAYATDKGTLFLRITCGNVIGATANASIQWSVVAVEVDGVVSYN